MSKKLSAIGLAAAVAAAAALVPLYGDARSAPVTHPEWARMLLRALQLERALPSRASSAQVFSILSWKNSLAYPGDAYSHADGVQVQGPAGGHKVLATPGVGEVSYPVSILQGGNYRLRVHMGSSAPVAASAEIAPFGETKPLRTFTLASTGVEAWVDAGATHLDPGAYTASLLLPAGAFVESVELAPPCLSAVEPQGGWQAEAAVQAEDVAVTVLKALDLEYELPPAASPIELAASDFRTTAGAAMAGAALGGEQLWLRAGPQGVEAVAFVDLPTAGLYTLSAFGLWNAGQAWLVDSCRKAVLCPRPEAAEAGWRPVLTAAFTAGRHSFTVTLPPGGAVSRLRIELKKDRAADYMATLARLGFDVGSAGPIARDRVVEAMHFVEQRRILAPTNFCGDVLPPGTLLAGLAEPASIVGPGGSPLFSGTGRPPLAPPELPAQQAASPILP